jgi:oligoendopeptidase F
MFTALPSTTHEFQHWSWSQIEPYYRELIAHPLDSSTLYLWLDNWSNLRRLVIETYNRLYVATTQDTTDEDAQNRYHTFLDQIYPATQTADYKLKEKLISSALQPEGFDIPMRNMRAEVDLFREANLSLLAEDLKLGTEYDRLIGAQTVEWEGKEVTLLQLYPVNQNTDRMLREKAWWKATERQLADRHRLDEMWVKYMDLRGKIAANAGRNDYRTYRWQQLLRFDYTPQDCAAFHAAIEEVVVPAIQRLYEKRRKHLGLNALRPWDLDVDPLGRPPLHPFNDLTELETKVSTMFQRVDPQLAEYFEIMRRAGLLDLDNRKGKAPGGYCTDFPVERHPFIFMNAIGIHDDVQTLLHEGGHAFHVFETSHLNYHHQLQITMEFAEVASMAMELLAAPYLPAREGGFYSDEDTARARQEHLEVILRFWPYMAVVDAFQQWAYENHLAASVPANCDTKWAELWRRFMVGVDWSGFEDVMKTGWQRKLHIYQSPYYYVEYGIAELGAIQIWANALKDQSEAVSAYRKALSLGGTATLPELYKTAGARFSFDKTILKDAVALVEETIERLEYR